jgi:hypothetical protein
VAAAAEALEKRRAGIGGASHGHTKILTRK